MVIPWPSFQRSFNYIFKYVGTRVFLTLINQHRLFDFAIEADQSGKKSKMMILICNGINFRQGIKK